jgi:hypothetical protein
LQGSVVLCRQTWCWRRSSKSRLASSRRDSELLVLAWASETSQHTNPSGKFSSIRLHFQQCHFKLWVYGGGGGYFHSGHYQCLPNFTELIIFTNKICSMWGTTRISQTPGMWEAPRA